jgi:predicted DCC family thiol-disulfide oxidoreductase YuxK
MLCFCRMPPGAGPEILFYDGHCALCHGAVKFVLKRDRAAIFHFAPLQGETFQSRVPPEKRTGLPDSVIILAPNGDLLTRSSAFLHILRKIGGGWKLLASVLAIIPRPIRDAAYDLIARIRYSVFGTRDDLCPIVPPDLRTRFLL